MKPILIDAIHIHMSGALAILNHLVNSLVKQNVEFVLLKDARCPQLESEGCIKNVVVQDSIEQKRALYYKMHKHDFHSILCMGNVPPRIKMPCKVYTYFHNVSLLKIPLEYNKKWIIRTFLKRIVIRFYSRNTDGWIVQTENTELLVRRKLPIKNKAIYRYPIYHIPDSINLLKKEAHGQDYFLVGFYTYAKGHDELLLAWRKLHEMGYDPCLHFTIQPTAPEFKRKVDAAISEGVNIIDHGKLPYEEIGEVYRSGKALIYPSYNESLGLGLIEAIHAGCDVIASDLPFTYSVCKPSETFKVKDVESLVDAILRYEMGKSPQSKLVVSDKVNELIELLVS